MTAKELAEMLSGREYGEEITMDEVRQVADAGLAVVVVYGYSDDNVEFRGAIDEEVGAWGGTTIYITPNGLLKEPACSDAENCTCPYFTVAKSAAKTIKAVWHDEGGPCWTFETDIPHETFSICEDGELFCEGIVFNMQDIGGDDTSPLTLAELREMDGEPVWCQSERRPEGAGWYLVEASAQLPQEFIALGKTRSIPCAGIETGYWKAYRRKPEEAAP